MRFNQAVSQLNEFSQTATLRHGGVSFAGTIINGLLGIIYFFYLAAKLSPDNFGRFSIAVGITAIGFSIFNLGLDQSIVKFKSDLQVLANIIFLKLIISIIITIIPILFFGTNNLYGLVGLGIAVKLLFSMSVNFLQSWEKYLSWSVLFIFTNLSRLIVSLLATSLNPVTHFWIYSFMPLSGFIVFYLFFTSKLPKPQFNYYIIQKIFVFNFYLTVNSIFSAFTSQIETFFIAGFQTFALAGVYSLAVQLASSVSQLATAYSATISPKFSSLDSQVKNRQYLYKNLIFSSTISLLLIPILLLTGLILKLPALLLALLIFGYVVFFASIPLRESLLYFFTDTKVFLYLSILNFLISILSGFFFIRQFGPLAAATSFLVSQILSVIILIYRYVYQNNRSYHS